MIFSPVRPSCYTQSHHSLCFHHGSIAPYFAGRSAGNILCFTTGCEPGRWLNTKGSIKCISLNDLNNDRAPVPGC